MNKHWMAALGLAACAGWTGSAQASVAWSLPASPPSALGEDSAFDKLEGEYKAARADWDVKAKEARETKQKAPPRVEASFWGRFEEFANKGDARAMFWCVRTLRYANLSSADLKAKVPVLYEKLVTALLVDESVTEPIALADLLSGHVPDAVGQQFLTLEQAQGFCTKVQNEAKADDSKAAAMLVAGTLPNQSIEDEAEQEQKNLVVFKAVLAKYPKSKAGLQARGEVNRLENLAVGKVAPEFGTTDVEGVDFKLADYRGKVVVIDFWGFW